MVFWLVVCGVSFRAFRVLIKKGLDDFILSDSEAFANELMRDFPLSALASCGSSRPILQRDYRVNDSGVFACDAANVSCR